MSFLVVTKKVAIPVVLFLSARVLCAILWDPMDSTFQNLFNIVDVSFLSDPRCLLRAELSAIIGIFSLIAYSRGYLLRRSWTVSSTLQNRPEADDTPVSLISSRSSATEQSSNSQLPKIILPENRAGLDHPEAEDGDQSDDESTVTTNILESKDAPQPVFLCIKCREAGHSMAQCCLLEAVDVEDWTLARLSTETPHGNMVDLGTEMCSRCQRSGIINLFKKPNFTSSKEASECRYPSWRDAEGREQLHYLGRCDEVFFQQSCPLCRLLFSTIPPCNAFKASLVVVPAWTLQRQEPALTSKFRDASYATCLYVAIDRPGRGQMMLCSEARDLICILDDNSVLSAPHTATGRKIQQLVDFELLRSWLDRCNDLHDIYCKENWSESLRNIRLIDVKSRKIVDFPGKKPCQYLALSYVWGNMSQSSRPIGSKIGRIAGTIEDAIEATRRLGIRYLWVDSLCIDQRESAHKADQIKLMSAIYRGAFATIVALSGRCAESGLPRVTHRRKRYPDIVFPQLTFVHDDQVLGTTMPTLKQQISRSLWAKRAWTYQEGLLSPRCLYFTQHQVYFECNITQRCETLKESNLPIHTQKILKLNPTYYSRPANVLGKGFLTNPFLGLSDYSNNQRNANDRFLGLLSYGQIVTPYTTRKMTHQSDAIEAVSGLLQQLEIQYYAETGFFWGLPCADFALALLWKQGKSRRRADFPSWSWAGWEGAMLEAYPKDAAVTKWIATPLRAYKAKEGPQAPVCESLEENEEEKYRLPGRPPKANDRRYISPWSLLSFLPELEAKLVEESGIVFVHGVVLSLALTEILAGPSSRINGVLPVIPSNPRRYNLEEFPVQYQEWDARMRKERWETSGMLYDNSWRDDGIREELNVHANQMRNFLLLARYQHHDGVCHKLLLLEQGKWQYHDQVYTRVAVMSLVVKYPQLYLGELNARRIWIAMA